MLKTISALGAAFLIAISVGAQTLDELVKQSDEARRVYSADDAAKAFQAIQEYAKTNEVTEEVNFAIARSALTLATLYRIQYEEKEKFDPKAANDESMKRKDMRILGQRIDDASWIGHKALDALPESSEQLRIRADLWGMMIRTSYRGTKYGELMDECAQKSLALDDKNPYAYVTASKRKLFATERRGGDHETAMSYLNKALELKPDFEDALILRGIGYKDLGEKEKAAADWKRALEVNPESYTAKKQLEKIGEPNTIPALPDSE